MAYGYWISPDGVEHEIINEFGHKEFIEMALNKTFDSDVSAVQEALSQGWMRIVTRFNSFQIDYRYLSSIKQLKTLINIERKYKRENDKYINYIISLNNSYKFFNHFSEVLDFIKDRDM